MEANRIIESLPICSAPKFTVHERPGVTSPGPPTHTVSNNHSPISPSLPDVAASSESESDQNSLKCGSGFFTNGQNIVITGGTFILNVRGEQHGASDRKSPLRSKREAERYLNSSTSDDQHDQHGFIGKSTTVDELPYMPSQEEKTRDAERVVATDSQSKSWKTLRGEGEAVWPSLLQAALIEALEKHQQGAIGSRAQQSGRLSMRNRFISDYIYETTGKSRTPKQVGNRLQQLRDICNGDKDCSSRPSITPPPDEAPSPMPTFINVQISLQKVLRPCPVPAVRFVDNDPMNPHVIKLSPLSYVDPKIRTLASSKLSYLSGTVNFSSPCTLALQSTFLVYLDNSSTPLHSEIAPLKCLSSPTNQSVWLYSSEIAPDFWDTLCSSPDLSRYTILQSVKPIPAVHFESDAVTDSSRAGPTVFIAYKFSYQEPGPQASIRWPFHTCTQRHIQQQHPANPLRWAPYHPHLRSYSPNSRSSFGSWFDDRDSGEGQYWQHRY